MFLASIAHILAFPITPYKVDDQRLNWMLNIANAANVSDLHFEVKIHYEHFYSKVKNAFKKNDSNRMIVNKPGDDGDPDENTRLLDSTDRGRI